jgi:hypothetical protein
MEADAMPASARFLPWRWGGTAREYALIGSIDRVPAVVSVAAIGTGLDRRHRPHLDKGRAPAACGVWPGPRSLSPVAIVDIRAIR